MQSNIESNLEALRQVSQRKIIEVLDQIPSEKDLIIDPVLMKPLDRVTGVSVLREHGVDKMFKLEKAGVPAANPQRVYLIYSDLITAKYVCDQINSEIQKELQHTVAYHIILVPWKLASIDQLLEEEGIFGNVKVYQLAWDLIPLDRNILSLEFHSFFKMLFLNGDQSFLPPVAMSLWTLQLIFGRIPCVVGQGRYSKIVYDMMNTFIDKLGDSVKKNNDIGCLVLIDRDVDYAASLLTPVTYTSLLDEVFELRSNTVEFDTAITGENNTINYQLSSKDMIYNEIKNRHFSDVFSFLSSKAKQLQTEFGRSQNMALKEMKQYIANELKKTTALKQSLAYHVGACEVIIDKIGQEFENLQRIEQNMIEGRSKRENCVYIEDSIATQTSKLKSLRLISLLSITLSGLSQDDANSIKSHYLHSYGYEHLVTFHNLERLGLFTQQGSLISLPTGISMGDSTGKIASRMAQVVSLPRQGGFRTVAQKMKLLPDAQDDYDVKNPKDVGYVFSGSYIPVACQLVHLLLKKESRAHISDILKLLPGPTVWESVSRTESVPDITPRVILVYFIGGVTYAEIAAFQLLEKLTGCQIIVAGTSIINGNSLIKSAL